LIHDSWKSSVPKLAVAPAELPADVADLLSEEQAASNADNPPPPTSARPAVPAALRRKKVLLSTMSVTRNSLVQGLVSTFC
jgi:hypothetical protein